MSEEKNMDNTCLTCGFLSGEGLPDGESCVCNCHPTSKEHEHRWSGQRACQDCGELEPPHNLHMETGHWPEHCAACGYGQNGTLPTPTSKGEQEHEHDWLYDSAFGDWTCKLCGLKTKHIPASTGGEEQQISERLVHREVYALTNQPKPTPSEEWAKEFEKQFGNMTHVGCRGDYPCGDIKRDVKSFIKSLLSQERARGITEAQDAADRVRKDVLVYIGASTSVESHITHLFDQVFRSNPQ